MKYGTFEVFTFILLIASSTSAGEQLCHESISTKNFVPDKCISNKKNIEKCVNDSHKKSFSITTDLSGNIAVSFKQTVCINSIVFTSGISPVQAIFKPDGNFWMVKGFINSVSIGRITFNDSKACGFDESGKLFAKLPTKFAFIPTSTKLILRDPHCVDTTFDPPSIQLAEAANICDAVMPAGTRFFYQPDDACHFVALSNTKMLYADPDSDSQKMDIKKGRDYRNFDPAKSPCIWSETPADVLKSFQDGTSD